MKTDKIMVYFYQMCEIIFVDCYKPVQSHSQTNERYNYSEDNVPDCV